MRRLLLAMSLVWSAIAAPSHGPARGYLVISGGVAGTKEFLDLAGANARIVVIPTAGITTPVTQSELARFCATPEFAHLHCTVLHTTDRKVADSEEFVKPLLDANAVWLEGGRHWRLADAYLGTRTLKEMFNLLDRGGVIGGASAGATIQGSYMVRASSNPDDNTIMMAPGHEVGFGFFTNVTVDQHVDARHRENDLAPVMKAHPELLGFGLDQNCSITVHGDTVTVNGPQRAALWDGKDHDGKGYYYLVPGDKLDTVTRVATRATTPPPGTHKEITVSPETLAAYAGKYRLAPSVIMTVTVEDGQLVSQIAGQPKLPYYAEGEGKFFAKIVEAQIEFVKGADGKVTEAIVHHNGMDRKMTRLDEAEAKRIEEETARRAAVSAQRFKEQKPAPGGEAALRRIIEEGRRGEPDYELLSQNLANATRQQLPQIKELMKEYGAVQSVTFKGVGQNGADIYQVRFENASTEWRISMENGVKVASLNFRKE